MVFILPTFLRAGALYIPLEKNNAILQLEEEYLPVHTPVAAVYLKKIQSGDYWKAGNILNFVLEHFFSGSF